MTSDTCDGCGREVPIAGGIANLWTFESDQTGGVTLELEDGTEHFLCFECTSRLPDDATTADVEAIDYDPDEVEMPEAGDDDGPGSVGVGIALGAVVGAAVGIAFDDLRTGLAVGLGIGLAIGVLADRIAQRRAE